MIYKNTTKCAVLFMCIIFLSTHTAFASIWPSIIPSDETLAKFKKEYLNVLGKEFNEAAQKTITAGAKDVGREIAEHAEPKLGAFSTNTLNGINKELSRIPGLIEEGTYQSVRRVAPFIVPVLSCGLGACMGMVLMYQSLNEMIKLKTVDQSLPDELQHNNDPKHIEREEIQRKARWFNAILRGASGFTIVVACVTTNSFVQPTEEAPKKDVTHFRLPQETSRILFPDWNPTFPD